MSNIIFKVHNSDVAQKNRQVVNHLTPSDIQAICKEGYLRMPMDLDDEYSSVLKHRISELLDEHYVDTSSSTYKTGKFGGQYLRQPHEQHPEFLQVVTKKYPYLDIVRSLIGPRVVIRSYSVRVTHPYSQDGTAWHSDQRSLVTPRPILFTEPRVMTLGIYLDGATEENGPFQVMPGSHLWERQPEGNEMFEPIPGEQTMQFKPGEAVLFDAAIWHRGGENRSGDQRRMLIIHFAPIFCKPANYTSVPPSESFIAHVDRLRTEGDEAALELLGFNGLKMYPGFM